MDASLTLAYSFTQIGNYILYLFIIFASAFYGKVISVTDHLLLPLMTLISFVGTYNSTINAYDFFMHYLGFPKQSMVLFIQVISMTQNLQPVTAVMGFYFFSTMTLAKCYKIFDINKRKLFNHCLIFFIFIILIPISIKAKVFPVYCLLLAFYLLILLLWRMTGRITMSNKKKIVVMLISVGVLATLMLFIQSTTVVNVKKLSHHRLSITAKVKDNVISTVSEDASKVSKSNTQIDTLQQVSQHRHLKFGFHPRDVPLTYLNKKDEPAGFAIAFAYKMAKQLNVSLEFVSVPVGKILPYLEAGIIDVAMTADFLNQADYDTVSFSEPIRYSKMVFLTLQGNEHAFVDSRLVTRDAVKDIGVIAFERWYSPLSHYLPKVAYKSVDDIDIGLKHLRKDEISALILPFYYAVATVYDNSDMIVVVPKGAKLIMPFSFVLRKNLPNFLSWIDHWIGVIKAEGFYKDTYEQWILGHFSGESLNRWNLIDWLFKTYDRPPSR